MQRLTTDDLDYEDHWEEDYGHVEASRSDSFGAMEEGDEEAEETAVETSHRDRISPDGNGSEDPFHSGSKDDDGHICSGNGGAKKPQYHHRLEGTVWQAIQWRRHTAAAYERVNSSDCNYDEGAGSGDEEGLSSDSGSTTSGSATCRHPSVTVATKTTTVEGSEKDGAAANNMKEMKQRHQSHRPSMRQPSQSDIDYYRRVLSSQAMIVDSLSDASVSALYHRTARNTTILKEELAWVAKRFCPATEVVVESRQSIESHQLASLTPHQKLMAHTTMQLQENPTRNAQFRIIVNPQKVGRSAVVLTVPFGYPDVLPTLEALPASGDGDRLQSPHSASIATDCAYASRFLLRRGDPCLVSNVCAFFAHIDVDLPYHNKPNGGGRGGAAAGDGDTTIPPTIPLGVLHGVEREKALRQRWVDISGADIPTTTDGKGMRLQL